MRVLGVDPGTARVGYGVVEGEGSSLRAVTYGLVTTSTGTGLPERLQEIYQALRGLLAETAPEALAAEELFFSRNARTALAVGQARGVVLLAAAHAGVPVFEYTPLQVKQAVAGYGKASKEQVQEMVRVLLGLPEAPKPDDVADALAVAICHLHSARMAALLAQE
ncbi:MAG: crossover junction endodeoxyribonuclease RuvC [Anaerolineae bacterium]